MPERVRTSRFVALIALLLGGCIAVPAHQSAPIPIAKLPQPPVATVNAFHDWPAETWWQAYADPQLDDLIGRALADSPTLAGAYVRMAQASAMANFARSSTFPQVSADLGATYGRQSANYINPPPPLGSGGQYVTQGQAAINLGYDLDLWGRSAALIRSAQDQADAAGFDYAAARLALTTSIARVYAQLASQYDLLDIVTATYRQRNEIADLTEKRMAAGLDTRIEFRQAETSSATLRSEQIQLEAAINVSALQLAALSGAVPDGSVSITRPQLHVPAFNLPATLPLDLLSRRPEIAAQRARIGAAVEEVKAAEGQFYPNINLAAMIGFQSFGLNRLFTPGSLASSVGPAIHLPLFDGGRLRAGYALKRAEQDSAIAQYNQSVLNAAQDVVEQMTRGRMVQREAEATASALAAAQESYRITRLRYREGLTSYLTVLAVENQLFSQQRAMADVRARTLDLQIALVRALGGGFVAPPQSSGKFPEQ
ncbi:MAG: efflux transporter outer membrane subunit [Pseudomonadota bacterium]